MPPPKPNEYSWPEPVTPQRVPGGRDGTPNTPANRRASAQAGATPKSAPAAGAIGSQKKKPEPTLLGDFLLGRPSPARVAAQRASNHQRRKTVGLDAAGVREELRQEMRAAAVRKLQQPSHVRDRVKAWQKGSVTAMKTQGGGAPDAEDAMTEPTDFGEQIDDEEVTEKDRVRIQMRRKTKKAKPRAENIEIHQVEHEGDNGEEAGYRDEYDEWDEDVTSDDPRLKVPPRKRIVSDDNWMKRRKGRSPPRTTPNKARPKISGSPTPIPKDFLQRTAQNPSAQNKVKEWATRVEIPSSPRVKQYYTGSGETVTVEEDASSVRAADDGIRTKPSKPVGDGIRVKPVKPSKAEAADDGIRIKPMRMKMLPDDGIRIHPQKTSLPDDGIRIRPGRKVSRDDSTVRAASSRRTSQDRSTRVSSTRLDASPSEEIVVVEEDESEVNTPSRKPERSGGSSKRRPKRKPSATTVTQTEITDATSETGSGGESGSSHRDSDAGSQEGSLVPPTVLGNKSLKEIPFGYSAFSELDLPLGADARTTSKRPKAQRTASAGLKAVPNVLKKVVSGAKEIIHEKVDPPKPVVNQPPSIESWLDKTVDPFVEAPPKRRSLEKEWAKENRRRSSSEIRQKTPTAQTASTVTTTTAESHDDQENADPQQDKAQETTPREKTPSTPTAGLKRSRATRSSSSPLKSGGRRPFRDMLKEVFKGESGGHRMPAMVYPTCDKDDESDLTQEDGESDFTEPRRRSSGSNKRSPSPDPSSTVDSSIDSASTSTPAPRRRPPPTNGLHELSTIFSEEASSIQSDTMSSVSQSTVTQSTALTKDSEVSRKTSGRPGLKRRLTKHSDLVSVLSLPDDGQLVPPSRSKSIKSSRSIHRKPSKLDKGGIDALLREFADDEHFYQRELKTLVDGVIPVLLAQVVHRDSRSTAALFAENATNARNEGKSENLSKAVVNMGIALEKLRNYHKRVPLADVHQLFTWLEAAGAIYDNYLDVWRLGFQDLIINLAPAAGKMEDDDDSLINALPRNEEGDVVGENGERVDVAYLLKKPLARVKWLHKFLKAATLAVATRQGDKALVIYEALHEKARKRHREETARVTDEDASNTDATRARDLRNLAALDDIIIDHTRQVAAKDSFFLDLRHSNGQRLECQVELIHRDKPPDPADKGDILIRDITNSRPWLLFPPIPAEMISARRGGGHTLVVMIRGIHRGREWYELLKLSTDSDEQIQDWLDILGSDPLPLDVSFDPDSINADVPASPKPVEVEIPVGERKLRKQPPLAPLETTKTPSRYHARHASVPTTPTTDSPRRTPPSKLTKSPPNTTPYREDGAPPPPIHRSLAPKSPHHLTPPVDLGPPSRVKRRTSSPLKHEYHPSDVSSEEGSESASDDSDSDSSSDELEENEVPDTVPGYSIKDQQEEPSPAESVVTTSSITPSNSASQVGMGGAGGATPENPTQRFVADVSYWSDRKGLWKTVGTTQASIIVRPGGLEVHHLTASHSNPAGAPLQSSGSSEIHQPTDAGATVPLVALGLTPIVMIRQSNALDLEVRTKALPQSLLANKIDSATYRFRASSSNEARALYQAVHEARLNNAKYIALAEEARFRSFGENNQAGENDGDGDSSSHRRLHSWFGRKNSYRASTRAPSQSQGSGSSISASGFLRRMTGGNTSFDIEQSTVDKQSRPGTSTGLHGAPASLYTSSGSSSGAGTSTPPRSISASLTSNSKSRFEAGFAKQFNMDKPLRIRLHYNNNQSTRWHDRGDCILQITRPPPGVKQELAVYHGLEKRVIVTHCSKKDGDRPLILLDAVLGSGCFSMLGTKGIMCSIWEHLRDEEGKVGYAPKSGRISGHINKWCFQCQSAEMAHHIIGLLSSEVPQVILD
ncbi:hypothetical protein GQ53DRAFT_724206 [Thozetella sp. PMI_491]|nr:hypothetical protein GQ53DRAFT_724206 [Thozetella sp. PMI_491]